MKLITKDADYAIRAVCCMAKRKKAVLSVDEMARCLRIPRPFLRKILQTLNRRKILCSCKGRGGGFSLSVTPDNISLFDIITAVQGPVILNDHTSKKKPCFHTRKCNIKKAFDSIEKALISQLQAVTITSLLKERAVKKRLRSW